MLANIILWVGLYPCLRILIYPYWELKPFLKGMEIMSGALILLQAASLWSLYGWPRRRWHLRPWLSALGLLPVIWLINALVLWVFMEFRLLPEPLLEPLYDSQLFIRRHPWSWTALSFMLSAIGEEIFFRAWLPDYLGQRLRKSAAIGLSALLFALAHLSLHTSAQAFLAYLLFALSLSYVRSCHGLEAAIGVHLLNNILAFVSLGFQFNVLDHLRTQQSIFYLAIALLMAGLFLVGRDIKRLVDKGADAP